MNTDKPLLTEREAGRLLAASIFLGLKASAHLFAVVLVGFAFIGHFDGHPLSGLLFAVCLLLLAFCSFVLSVDWKRGF